MALGIVLVILVLGLGVTPLVLAMLIAGQGQDGRQGRPGQ